MLCLSGVEGGRRAQQHSTAPQSAISKYWLTRAFRRRFSSVLPSLKSVDIQVCGVIVPLCCHWLTRALLRRLSSVLPSIILSLWGERLPRRQQSPWWWSCQFFFFFFFRPPLFVAGCVDVVFTFASSFFCFSTGVVPVFLLLCAIAMRLRL